MKFLNIIRDWINDYFSHEEAVYLVVLTTVVFVFLFTLGGVLAPVLTGLVIAFLLQGLVKAMVRFKVPHLGAVTVSFVVFLGAVFAILLLVVPLLWQQLQELVGLAPTAITRLRFGLDQLAERFPEYVTQTQISALLDQGARDLGNSVAGLLVMPGRK